MTQIEFITGSRVSGLEGDELYEFVFHKILSDAIVILEKELDAQEQMEFIAKGLEKVTTQTSMGINFVPFYVTTQVAGLFKNKNQDVQFNLITPASSSIRETTEGQFSVTTPDGDIISAGF